MHVPILRYKQVSKTPVTPGGVSTVLPRSCLIFQSTVRTQEHRDILVKVVCYGVLTATNALPRSSHDLLSRSYGVHGGDSVCSRCFHCASTALTSHAPRFHGVATALRTQWHLQERRAVSVQTPRTTTAYA